MDDKKYRLWDRRDRFFVWEDKSIFEPDFPEYLKMIQIQGQEYFVLQQSLGVSDINGKEIYVEDIVKFKDCYYRVGYESANFFLECLAGKQEDSSDVDYEEVEVVGNTLENGSGDPKEPLRDIPPVHYASA